jgi:hypothetical protein
MGGSIEVTSTLGQGSTFSFRLSLPVAENVAAPEQNDQTAYAALRARIVGYGRPLRVLIADDNPTNRLVASKMLRASRFRPTRRVMEPRRSPPPIASTTT